MSQIGLEAYPETADIETSSEDYARRFSGDVGRWFLSVQEEVTLGMLARHPGAAVLDVGGGHGQLTGGLIEHGYKVTVFSSAQACRNRIHGFVDEGRCDFQVGDILDLPYGDRSFDAVVSYRLLPHVTRWTEFVSELARVARATVILDCPSIRSLNCLTPLLFPMKKRWEGNTRPYTLFRESAVVAELRARGLLLARRHPQFFLPMVVHRSLGSARFSRVAEALCRRSGLTRLFGSPVILQFVRPGEAGR